MGEPVVYPSFRMLYVENFLNMLFSSPVRNYHQDPDIVRAIELVLLLHGDHNDERH